MPELVRTFAGPRTGRLCLCRPRRRPCPRSLRFRLRLGHDEKLPEKVKSMSTLEARIRSGMVKKAGVVKIAESSVSIYASAKRLLQEGNTKGYHDEMKRASRMLDVERGKLPGLKKGVRVQSTLPAAERSRLHKALSIRTIPKAPAKIPSPPTYMTSAVSAKRPRARKLAPHLRYTAGASTTLSAKRPRARKLAPFTASKKAVSTTQRLRSLLARASRKFLLRAA